MTRIALIPSSYLPTLGGVQELTRHLALALVDAGDEVEIWWTQDAAVRECTTEVLDGLTIRRFPFLLPNRQPRSIGRAVVSARRTFAAMRQAVAQFKPDILHVQCFAPSGIYAAALSRSTGVPLVVTLQGETVMDDEDIYNRSLMLRTGLRLGLKQAARVTGCSAFTLRDAEKRFGLKPAAGTVIFNGVDLDEAQSSAAPPADLGRYVVALGRIVPKKGFDLLIRGFAEIAAAHPSVTLAIGGDGWALPELRELTGQLGLLDRVTFLGRLSRAEVAATLRGAEVFVMPSRMEPFGIVLVEAWRAGTAVVSTSVGGPPEFVADGRTGLLVEPFDPAALGEALDRLLGDERLRRQLGAAGHEQVREFGWPVIAGRYQQIYRDAMTRPN